MELEHFTKDREHEELLKYSLSALRKHPNTYKSTFVMVIENNLDAIYADRIWTFASKFTPVQCMNENNSKTTGVHMSHLTKETMIEYTKDLLLQKKIRFSSHVITEGPTKDVNTNMLELFRQFGAFRVEQLFDPKTNEYKGKIYSGKMSGRDDGVIVGSMWPWEKIHKERMQTAYFSLGF